MKPLLYATGNAAEFRQARLVCEPAGITLVQGSLDVPEIQDEDAENIARDKANKGFVALQKPLIISDDSWSIPGLKGFPGPYMKSMEYWLEVGDWLNLTRSLQDRRIILRQIVIYQDESTQQLFSRDLEGLLLTKPTGEPPYSHSSITSFDGGIHSAAEVHQQGKSSTIHLPNVWRDFVAWYASRA
jgi:XTP/dITP diphosphohydrolase